MLKETLRLREQIKLNIISFDLRLPFFTVVFGHLWCIGFETRMLTATVREVREMSKPLGSNLHPLDLD
jgi:hypothetical protein